MFSRLSNSIQNSFINNIVQPYKNLKEDYVRYHLIISEDNGGLSTMRQALPHIRGDVTHRTNNIIFLTNISFDAFYEGAMEVVDDLNISIRNSSQFDILWKLFIISIARNTPYTPWFNFTRVKVPMLSPHDTATRYVDSLVNFHDLWIDIITTSLFVEVFKESLVISIEGANPFSVGLKYGLFQLYYNYNSSNSRRLIVRLGVHIIVMFFPYGFRATFFAIFKIFELLNQVRYVCEQPKEHMLTAYQGLAIYQITGHLVSSSMPIAYLEVNDMYHANTITKKQFYDIRTIIVNSNVVFDHHYELYKHVCRDNNTYAVIPDIKPDMYIKLSDAIQCMCFDDFSSSVGFEEYEGPLIEDVKEKPLQGDDV